MARKQKILPLASGRIFLNAVKLLPGITYPPT
jgi:hypothetical protein